MAAEDEAQLQTSGSTGAGEFYNIADLAKVEDVLFSLQRLSDIQFAYGISLIRVSVVLANSTTAS